MFFILAVDIQCITNTPPLFENERQFQYFSTPYLSVLVLAKAKLLIQCASVERKCECNASMRRVDVVTLAICTTVDDFLLSCKTIESVPAVVIVAEDN